MFASSTYFDEAFVQSVYLLDRGRVRKGQHVRAKSDHIAMLPMKLDVGYLRPSPVDIKKSPPISKGSQQRSWITVETVGEVVTGKEESDDDEQRCWPVALHD